MVHCMWVDLATLRVPEQVRVLEQVRLLEQQL
jgi:hypothetical protein